MGPGIIKGVGGCIVRHS